MKTASKTARKKEYGLLAGMLVLLVLGCIASVSYGSWQIEESHIFRIILMNQRIAVDLRGRGQQKA